MSSILEQLYAGDLTPAENVIQGNEEYDRLCRQSVQEIEEFSKKLDRWKAERVLSAVRALSGADLYRKKPDLL